MLATGGAIIILTHIPERRSEMNKLAVFVLGSVLLATPALAQSEQPKSGMESGGMQMGQGDKSGGKMMNAADDEFMTAMQKMSDDMMQADDADIGKAWMKKMIEHHKGAVEMSRIVLKHSKDKDVEKEAKKTIDENEKSIKEIQSKLKKD